MKALPIVIGTGVAGLGAILYVALTSDVHTYKETPPPDVAPPPPGKTGHKKVDALLPQLATLADKHNVPLGLLVGWIVKESAGLLASHTPLDERGYFQLSPEESARLKIDHQRLSTDSAYSLEAGPRLIHEYEPIVQALKIPAADGYSAFYWLLTKLCHTVGTGQTKKWAQAALTAGQAGSWPDFEAFVLSKSWKGPQPKKWLPFMDDLYRIGAPFGFNGASSAPRIAGEMWSTSNADGGRTVYGGGRPSTRAGLLGLDVFTS